MITVKQALRQIFDLVTPVDIEWVPLVEANGRILAEPAIATRDQPPFAASAMDGYAVIGTEVEPDAMFKVIGEAAAGREFGQKLRPGQAARIFTGAPVPAGATRVVIQEDVTRKGDVITLHRNLGARDHIRPGGSDFRAGDKLDAPRRLSPADVGLLASMNIPKVPVYRRPVIALLATGDELVMPGESPRPDQIIASNGFGLKALLENAGAEARMLPIARDTEASLETAFGLTQGADMIATIGGASVGDHDLVGKVAEKLGLERAFYRVAMRPGKPLMAGKIFGIPMIGLPGNPVSSMVCAQLFILPALRAMTGFPAEPAPRLSGALTGDLGPNGPREHYMRARLDGLQVAPFEQQDSALQTVLSQANALIVRPPNDPARKTGASIDVIAF